MATLIRSVEEIELMNPHIPPLDPKIGHTNDILDNDQVLHVQAHLSGALEELEQWGHQLAIILAHHARVATRVHRCNVALAPYKKLPIEIMKEILVLAVGPISSLPLSEETELDARLQVTQVCAAWRRIAFDTPQLWDLVFSRNASNLSAFKLGHSWWSQCSGSRLLLNMELPKSNSRSSFDDNLLFNYIIAPFSSRLRSLQVLLKPSIARKVLALPAGSFYALKKLTFRVESSNERILRPDQDLNTAFIFTPHLTDVEVFVNSLLDPWLLRVTWTQISRLILVIQDLSADLLLLLFSQCTMLRICAINSVKDIDDNMIKRISTMPIIPLHLKELTWLQINFSGPTNHSYLFSALSLPKLSTFRVSNNDQPLDMSEYVDLIGSTTSTLNAFQILEVGKNEPLWFLTAPSLPKFNVDRTLISYLPHITLFTVPPNHFIQPAELEEIASGDLLPSVTQLEFSTEEIEPVFKMLKKRLSLLRQKGSQLTVPPIRRVLLRCPDSTLKNLDLEDMINDLRQQEVNIKIVSL
ncbi:hypothetical protein BDZ94DRAFT_1258911 [Collybia nuda]|uniref:F-box domain-containing protein n=1 Tax=Collybia nuda TaxID=64659 RepID=A0A9P5Y8Y9_9AGAR|nr:hypothetical protein BDZ94DRAFT_1258911 [Collybia nuda]